MSNANKKWKLIKSKPVFESKWLTILENDYELPDGSKGEGYYHLSRPNYVLVIAIDKDNKIVVEENYRRGVDDFVYELPAGWVDEGESPKQAAERELKEEAGYSGEVKILGGIYAQPGFSSMKAFVATAKIDHSLKGDQELGHDEHIDYKLIDLEKVREMIQEGEIKDMGFLSAMQLAEKYLK